ncbi:hypothetical protein TNCT_406141 [Trichonephila clavata]|uniref:Uncharacterized protein n=1 Tax=Trichonephila clavata TaxID=2740835 RepID=A0A8X6FG96_TRICU|nr:hypothetical protein TNCT_406141 [Trichonephila clavata]
MKVFLYVRWPPSGSSARRSEHVGRKFGFPSVQEGSRGGVFMRHGGLQTKLAQGEGCENNICVSLYSATPVRGVGELDGMEWDIFEFLMANQHLSSRGRRCLV